MGRVQVEEEVKGLTHYLSKQAKLQDVICATNLPKFHIIFSGVVPPNPAELLGSRQFKDMIRVVRDVYDYIIIDTPPLGRVIGLCSCGGFLRWNCHCNLNPAVSATILYRRSRGSWRRPTVRSSVQF